MPVHKITIPRCPAPTLGGDLPTKIIKLKKGTLFDLLTLDILNYIDTWITGLEYNDKHKKFVSRINSSVNPVLRMLTFNQ